MHISGEAAMRLISACEHNQACDDAVILVDFDGNGPPVPLTTHEGEPLQLGHLRHISRAFSAWL